MLLSDGKVKLNKNALSFFSTFFFIMFLFPFFGVLKQFFKIEPETNNVIFIITQFSVFSLSLVFQLLWFSRSKHWSHVLFWCGLHAWVISWFIRAVVQSDFWITLFFNHSAQPMVFFFSMLALIYFHKTITESRWFK